MADKSDGRAIEAMSNTTDPGLDPLLLDPTRLSIVSLLAATRWAEFGFVRDAVELSDSALSKQVSTLSGRSYIEVRKGYVGKRPRTWLNLSTQGRRALQEHVAALQRIAAKAHHAASARADQDERDTGGDPGETLRPAWGTE
jgi:DNA-binding MarR family transcriptional regulator